MQQAVKAPKVNKYSEVGDILYNALSKLTDFDFIKDCFLAAASLFLYDLSS